MTDKTVTSENAAPAAQTTIITNPALERVAFTMKETAFKMGVGYLSVWRLVKRGKLKTCGGLRKRLIAKTELERFLQETTLAE